MNIIVNYFKSVQVELKKVVWPTKKSTTNHTILVILISILVALFLFFIDNVFVYILNLFLK